jgi:AhpD family alkylhydroperoxidase
MTHVSSSQGHTRRLAGISCLFQHTTLGEDDLMEPRIDLINNQMGAKIGKRMYSVSSAIEQSPLPNATQALVMLRASQLNGCGWCLDIHTKQAVAAGESSVRLNLVAAWRHATVFTEAERAALALTEEGTRLSETGVSDETWSRVRTYYDEDQMVALVALVAMINATNRLMVISNYQGGSYEPGRLAGMSS